MFVNGRSLVNKELGFEVPKLPQFEVRPLGWEVRKKAQKLKYYNGIPYVAENEQPSGFGHQEPKSAGYGVESSVQEPPKRGMQGNRPHSASPIVPNNIPPPESGPSAFDPPSHPHAGKPNERRPMSAFTADSITAKTTYKASVGVHAAPPPVVPSWVALDRQVLCFQAYFKESVTERREENFRTRKCQIYYYLEDGSMHIDEPKQDNSGIPQGVFLKRHRMPKQSGCRGPGLRPEFVTYEDLHIGGEVVLYGRTFHLISCDPFTRKFLEGAGLRPAPDARMPDPEPNEEYNKTFRARPKPKSTNKPLFSFGPDTRPLDLDRKVLRFYCCWDDTGSLFGDRHGYTLHYFLADDTVEVLEQQTRNSGRDPFPKLLSRMRLPRTIYSSIGGGPRSAQTRGRDNAKYYSFRDLGIGAQVEVFGRKMLLHDCDDYTRDFYIKYGKRSPQDMAPMNVQISYRARKTERETPPPTGFGTEEDSLRSVKTLRPKAPQKDFHKFFKEDGKVLRFQAEMTEDKEAGAFLSHVDRGRSFVFAYFLVDDAISIYEPPMRNSGVVGGRYLERGRVRKPGRRNAAPAFYEVTDVKVGAKIWVHGRLFKLLDADDYTLAFMESSAWKFPESDAAAVGRKARDALLGVPAATAAVRAGESEADDAAAGGADAAERAKDCLIDADTEGSGTLSAAAACRALESANGSEALLRFSQQEELTLARACGDGESLRLEDLLQLIEAPGGFARSRQTVLAESAAVASGAEGADQFGDGAPSSEPRTWGFGDDEFIEYGNAAMTRDMSDGLEVEEL